jgi:hypothetical protein
MDLGVGLMPELAMLERPGHAGTSLTERQRRLRRMMSN